MVIGIGIGTCRDCRSGPYHIGVGVGPGNLSDEGWCNIAWDSGLMAIDANVYANLRAFNNRCHYLVSKPSF
jgi:hypothetical protein